VTVKDLVTGEQHLVALDELVPDLRNRFATRQDAT
jgi:hypothetical protein